MHRSTTSDSSAVPPSGRSSRPRPRRFLLTGAAGFIGSALATRLAADGHQVHAVTRGIAPGPSPAPLHWWHLDLTDATRTRQVIADVRPDVVVHLASRASGDRSHEIVAPMFRDNVMSSINVMSAVTALPTPARVVLAGSIEEPRDVSAGPGAHSPYAAAKAANTVYATLYRDLWQLSVVVLRIATVYGPGDLNDARLIPHVVSSLVSGVAPQLGSGTRAIDWLYLDDAVDALIDASTADRADGAILDIGSGHPVRVRQVVERVVQLTGATVHPRFGAIPDPAQERVHVADPSRARELLGWTARTGLDDGLRSTIQWYHSRATPASAS